MEKRRVTSQVFFRELNLLYTALIAGSLVILPVVYFFLTPLDPVDLVGLRNLILVIFPILAFALLILSLLLFRWKIKQLVEEKKIGRKLQEYRTALLLRWAIIEGACYFCIIGFGLLRVNLVLALAVFLFAYFVMQKPTVIKAVTDLDLNAIERERLERPDEVLYETDG